jgi:hypothetical protein
MGETINSKYNSTGRPHRKKSLETLMHIKDNIIMISVKEMVKM